MRRYLLILGIPSIVLLFLPYTFNTSPWATVSSEFGLVTLLGGPFFLSIPILIAQTLVLLKRPFSKGERATYRVLAYAALAAELYFLALIWPAFLCAAAVWMMILSARKLNPEEATMVTLQAAWLPNAILCAIVFWNGWEIGAYLAAFTIALYTLEITLSVISGRKLT